MWHAAGRYGANAERVSIEISERCGSASGKRDCAKSGHSEVMRSIVERVWRGEASRD